MIRLGSLVSCAAIALGLSVVGCGSNGTSGTSDTDSGAPAGDSAAPGGDTAASAVLAAVPKNSEVAGWTIDPANDKTANIAAAIGTTEKQIEDYIDGASADFYNGYTPVVFGWQNYVNTTLPASDAPKGANISLYVLQMPDAAQASGVYTALMSANLYAKYSTWVDPSSPMIGTHSRIVDTGDHWWINFYKGNFYVEVNLSPSAGPAPNYTAGLESTKAAAIAFAQAVAAKI